jgi:hypothetical protein
MLINDLVELTLAPAGRKGGILLSAWRVIGTGPYRAVPGRYGTAERASRACRRSHDCGCPDSADMARQVLPDRVRQAGCRPLIRTAGCPEA